MIFITLQEIIDDHAEIIHKYGGLNGIRDMGLLASAIDMPKSTIDLFQNLLWLKKL